MHQLISLGFICFVFISAISCSTPPKNFETSSHAIEPSRTPQQVLEEENAVKQEVETQVQQALASRNANQLLEQHLDVHSMSQRLMEKFDAELEKLYQIKIKNQKEPIDLQNLERNKVELQAAWQFSEKSVHQIENVYLRLLNESQDPKSDQKAAAEACLSEFKTYFKKAWKEKNQAAVSALATDLDSVNERVKLENPQSPTVNFKDYLKLTAFSFQRKFLKKIQHNRELELKFQKFVEQRINEHQLETTSDSNGRSPQADDIRADSGSAGSINGSRFPAGTWSLTFDDGPHPTYTKGMIDALQSAGYAGTFFWLSKNMQVYKGVVQTAPAAKFRRGSHSFTHANLPKLGESGLMHEIDDAAQVFTDVVGDRPTLFRCPYGACGPNGSSIRQHIANQRMVHVMWNVDSLDWQDKNPRSIFERVKKQMELAGRGIVLFHDIHPQSVEATKLLVAYLQTKINWKVQPLDEIISEVTGREFASP